MIEDVTHGCNRQAGVKRAVLNRHRRAHTRAIMAQNPKLIASAPPSNNAPQSMFLLVSFSHMPLLATHTWPPPPSPSH